MGAMITNKPELLPSLRFHQNSTGAVPSAFDCWLATRGARTLEVRMRHHGLSALSLARWLDTEGRAKGWVQDVIYRGLEGSDRSRVRRLAWKQLAPEAREWASGLGYTAETGFPHVRDHSYIDKILLIIKRSLACSAFV